LEEQTLTGTGRSRTCTKLLLGGLDGGQGAPPEDEARAKIVMVYSPQRLRERRGRRGYAEIRIVCWVQKQESSRTLSVAIRVT
jgi:hypothetical protein